MKQTYLHVQEKKNFTAELADGVLTVSGPESNVIFNVENGVEKIQLSCKDSSSAASLIAMEHLFAHKPELKTISVNQIATHRADFYQNPALWCTYGTQILTPEQWMYSGDVRHPVRPQPRPGDLLYSRYVPAVGKTISFRVVDVERDLKTFHFWHNQPYVNEFWELAKPEAELKEYLEKGLVDLHSIPTFVEFDGVPVGYFEMYWTLEDRLGPYYESEAFDRGFHLLIGNMEYLGFKNTDAILKSASHYLFLEEPRTRKIMAEPRSDNQRIIRYVETFPAWRKVKEFDFPHKRAALLECRREKFFLGNFL
ncbi:GNAT family N-acetyltransferase [Bdellovibrio sp. HCB185ZH]|uniref:GNAT family N-acetyltransferase n=1 Tax=Bdellovibrio sp. HCB185ZH TaxID=3394235 RepID=UPI0039A6D633